MPIGEIGGVVRRRLGEREYFIGTCTSDKIRALTFVPTIEAGNTDLLEEETTDGYQRPGSKNRMRAFKKFLKEHPTSVVPPVLLCGRGNWRFEGGPVPDFGKLVADEPAAVIDGQHRVGGYVALFEELGPETGVRMVDFVLLNDLTLEEEKEEFITVNNTQKGVPKSLTAALQNEEGAQIAWALNEIEDSPFNGRITRTTMSKQHLFALHSVAKEIDNMFDFGSLADLSAEEKTQFAIRYWDIIADVFPDEWEDIEKLDSSESRGRKDFEFKLLELTGLIAWSRVAPHILGRCYSEANGMNWEKVRQLVEAASGIDWRKDGQYAGRTGAAGGPVIAQDIERLLPADPGVLPT